MSIVAREIHLKSRPDGLPTAANFITTERTLPQPGAGQLIVRNSFISATHEMYGVFKRTALLPILYEFNDFGMSLFDDQLNMLADAPGLPIFVGSLDTCTEATIEAPSSGTSRSKGGI